MTNIDKEEGICLAKKDGLIIIVAWAWFISLMLFPVRNSLVSVMHAESNTENVALQKTYTCHPIPDYIYCTDADDDIQLPDG